MRREVTDARRIVVKVGSSSLTSTEGGIDPQRVRRLVDVLAATRARGAEVCWCRPERSPPGWRRSGCGGAPGDAALNVRRGDVVVGDGIGEDRLVDHVAERAGVIVAAVGDHADLRAVTGQGLRHVLVDRTQRRALRVKRRIVLVGLHQRPFERIGRRPAAADIERSDERNGQHNACPSEACDGPDIRPHCPATHDPHTAPRPVTSPPGNLP